MPLQRRLNLFDATMLVAGNVVGAGIFTTAGFIARELPSPLLFLSIWLVGGMLTLCGALTYAEMAGMFPRSGGDYLFLKAAYGPWAGFLLGWVCFWIINPGSVAVLAIAAAKYLIALLHLGTGSGKVVALGIVAFFLLVNYQGIRSGGTAQNLWTGVSLAIILFFIICGLLSGRGDWGYFRQTGGHGDVSPLRLLGPAMTAVIFSYSGWFVSAYIGEEVKRPERNLPLSLVLGTCLVMVFYVLLNVTYLYALPLERLSGVVNVGQTAAESLLRPGAALFISVAIILAICASINATMLSAARLTFATAKDGLFWPALGRVHRKNAVPHVALLIQGLIAGLYIVVETFENLLNAVVFVMLLSSIGSGLAHIILRYKQPDAQRPYRTFAYPLVPLLFIFAYLWIAVQIATSGPLLSLAGLLVTLSGLPFYLWAFPGRRILDTVR